MVNGDIDRVLKVYSIGVWTVARGRDCHVEDLHGFTVVELQVELWAVLDGDAGDSHIVAPIEPQSLSVDRIQHMKLYK